MLQKLIQVRKFELSSLLANPNMSQQEKNYLKGLAVEAENSLKDEPVAKPPAEEPAGQPAAQQAASNEPQQPIEKPPVQEEVAQDNTPKTDTTVERFKALDKDGDLKVSAQEYTDDIVAEYMENGGKLPNGYSNIADYINDKFEEFKQFAGDDISMNIDEFRNMVEDRLNRDTTPLKSDADLNQV